MRAAVAIIEDEHKRILITRRPAHVPHGGKWEFPGGKLEQGESGESALVREIKEEVGLDIHEFTLLGEVTYDYPEIKVTLFVYHVTAFQGEAICCENQMDLRWEVRDNLHQFDFLAANQHILKLILS